MNAVELVALTLCALLILSGVLVAASSFWPARQARYANALGAYGKASDLYGVATGRCCIGAGLCFAAGAVATIARMAS